MSQINSNYNKIKNFNVYITNVNRPHIFKKDGTSDINFLKFYLMNLCDIENLTREPDNLYNIIIFRIRFNIKNAPIGVKMFVIVFLYIYFGILSVLN